jgi:hypothetical protein
VPARRPVPPRPPASANPSARRTRSTSAVPPGGLRQSQPKLPMSVVDPGQPGRFKHVPVTASCAGCTARWTDEAATHCSRCHGSWPTVAGFDEHLPACPGVTSRAPRSRRRSA